MNSAAIDRLPARKDSRALSPFARLDMVWEGGPAGGCSQTISNLAKGDKARLSFLAGNWSIAALFIPDNAHQTVTAMVWDIASGRVVLQRPSSALTSIDGTAPNLAYAGANGDFLVAGDWRGDGANRHRLLEAWRVTEARGDAQARTLQETGAEFYGSTAFLSPDGRQLAGSASDANFAIWHKTGRHACSGAVTACATSCSPGVTAISCSWPPAAVMHRCGASTCCSRNRWPRSAPADRLARASLARRRRHSLLRSQAAGPARRRRSEQGRHL